ncbi:MAG: hypothetical protein ACKVYV_01845, partial [Limisphaerales bacterium]
GQRLVTNFPVLDLGIHPDVPPDQWRLKLHGHVENPVTPARQALLKPPSRHRTGRLGEPALRE